MAQELKIDEQFIAYALQKHVSKLDGTETHFIFIKSKLWNHSATLSKYEFDSIFEKVCVHKTESKETALLITTNWQIINAIKGQTK